MRVTCVVISRKLHAPKSVGLRLTVTPLRSTKFPLQTAKPSDSAIERDILNSSLVDHLESY
jgi:hypothetical protein